MQKNSIVPHRNQQGRDHQTHIHPQTAVPHGIAQQDEPAAVLWVLIRSDRLRPVLRPRSVWRELQRMTVLQQLRVRCRQKPGRARVRRRP
eukprot:4197911-Prymnesium_polylepis.1